MNVRDLTTKQLIDILKDREGVEHMELEPREFFTGTEFRSDHSPRCQRTLNGPCILFRVVIP